jgi:hypothetical protein
MVALFCTAAVIDRSWTNSAVNGYSFMKFVVWRFAAEPDAMTTLFAETVFADRMLVVTCIEGWWQPVRAIRVRGGPVRSRGRIPARLGCGAHLKGRRSIALFESANAPSARHASGSKGSKKPLPSAFPS